MLICMCYHVSPTSRPSSSSTRQGKFPKHQEFQEGVSKIIVHNTKFYNSHKLKSNNCDITSNLIILDELSYFENLCILTKN